MKADGGVRAGGDGHMGSTRSRISRRAAEEAVRTLLRWAGEDPEREGLRDTPHRVVDAYLDWFSGYRIDPAAYLRRTFEEVGGYDEMIVLRDITFESHCEHHMAPMIGRVHIGYLPGSEVGVTSTSSSSAMNSTAYSSVSSMGGVRRIASSLPAARMLVSFLVRMGLTTRSFSRL